MSRKPDIEKADESMENNYALKEKPSMKCKYCGCTDDHACEGGCSWVAKDVCSKCASELVRVIQVDANGKWAGQSSTDWDCFGPGVLLKTEQRSFEGGCILRDHDLFIPLEAIMFTAEALLNTYQGITGETIRFKLGAGSKPKREL